MFGEVPFPGNPGGRSTPTSTPATSTTGAYVSEPFLLPITGYSRGACAKVLKEAETGEAGKKKSDKGEDNKKK